MLDLMRKKWNSGSSRSRRAKVTELLDVYEGDWKQKLNDKIDLIFEDREQRALAKQHCDTTLNALAWATDTIGASYSSPVFREIEGEEMPSEFNLTQIDTVLDTADKMLFLCRNVFARPVIDEVTGEIEYDIVTPDRVEVLTEEDPSKVSATLVQDANEGGFSYWEVDFFVRLDENLKVVPQLKNPNNYNIYGIIPWVDVNLSFPVRSFFGHQKSEPLLESTYLAGLAKTDHNVLRHVSSHKQTVIKGLQQSEASVLKIGATSPIVLQSIAADVDLLDMQVNLQGHFESIFQGLTSTLNFYGIKPEQAKGTLQAQSGYALSIQMNDTKRAWLKHQKIWKYAEQRLYDVASKIWLALRGKHLEEGVLTLSFSDLGIQSNPKEEADYFLSMVDRGLMSKMTFLREHRGYSEEEAQLELDRVNKETIESSPMGGGGGFPGDFE